MDRKGSAVWRGGLKTGAGTVSTETGVLKDQPYKFSNRFENEPGTNPEELIGAAHAACFSMAFSAGLEGEGMNPQEVATTATVTLEKVEGGFAVTRINLYCHAVVPGADEAAVRQVAEQSKATCPISKLLNAEISLDLDVEV